jgi:hypothetical protein
MSWGQMVSQPGGGMSGRRSSQDPADQLVRELLVTRRAVESNEVEMILHRIATAPFNTRPLAVDANLVGSSYLGRVLPERADSLSAHVWRRVLMDEQWAMGTTADEYLDDLHQAVQAPGTRLAIYSLRQSPHAVVIGPNSVPPHRRGQRTGALIVVPYSVNGGMLTSGYQVHDLASVSLPPSTRWLT